MSVGMLPRHRHLFVRIFWRDASTHNSTAGFVSATVAADPDLVSIIADFAKCQYTPRVFNNRVVYAEAAFTPRAEESWFITSFSAVSKSWRAAAKEIARNPRVRMNFFQLHEAHEYFKWFQSFRTQRVLASVCPCPIASICCLLDRHCAVCGAYDVKSFINSYRHLDKHPGMHPSGFSLDTYSFVRGVWINKGLCLPCFDSDQSDSDDDPCPGLLVPGEDVDDLIARFDVDALVQEATEYQHDESGFDLFD